MTFHFRKVDMQRAAAGLGHPVFASCDYLKRDGQSCGQKFVSFADHAQFADTILARGAAGDECCFYEMIREGRPCKMYFDVEWLAGPAAFGVADVQAVVAEQFMQAFAGALPGECVVLEGSRATSAGFKHSYHLVYPQVVFMRNDGRLKRFAIAVAAAVLARFGVKAVDTAVYSRDRAFRAPLCHKLVDTTRTRLQWAASETLCDDVHTRILRSMVSCVSCDTEGVHVVNETTQTPSTRLPKHRPAATLRPIAEQEGPWVSLLRDALQRFLAVRGGRGCVQRHGFVRHGNGSISFRYNHGQIGRLEPCLRHGARSSVR